MRITIENSSGRRRYIFLFPTAIIFNRVTAFFFALKSSNKENGFSKEKRKSAYSFVKEINKYKKAKKKQPLVEVDVKDSKVVLTL